MDIHRARFVPYSPSAINALAFSAPDDKLSSIDNLRLAVGRANGNIEIWNPANGAWVHETTFTGGKDRSVEGLAWIEEPEELDDGGHAAATRLRLFSIGYSSAVTEWDLATGLPLRHSAPSSTEVWCLAAQPPRRANKQKKALEDGTHEGQNLVSGCADGTLALLSTADGDLRFEKFISRPTKKKARVLSIAYQNRNIIVAGFADSTMRVFDTRSSSLVRTIGLGHGPSGGPKEILVWAVKCLPNGDIVSGDSTGDVRFYDGRSYAQIQRISGHEADVLSLATSADGKMVYSGGMDRRTVQYRLAGSASVKKRWAKLSHRRFHEHDVKAMATFESAGLSVVVSGGLDTNPIILPLREFGTEYSRTLPSLPQMPPVLSAPGQRLLVSWWDREVRIWRINHLLQDGKPPKPVARLAMRGEENISSASISRDGVLLAVSTAAEVKVFQLSTRKEDDKLRIRKLDGPAALAASGARLVQLSPDGKWLAVVSHSSEVFLHGIGADAQSGRRRRRLLSGPVQLLRPARPGPSTRSPHGGGLGIYRHAITRTQFSDDGRVLVVGDLEGYIDSWVADGDEDLAAGDVDAARAARPDSSDDEASGDEDDGRATAAIWGRRWIRNPASQLLPRLESSPLVLSFRPAVRKTRTTLAGGGAEGDHRLLVVTAQHQVYEFDVLGGRLSAWSRRNPSSHLPLEFRLVKDRAMGCVWDDGSGRDRAWLYGSNWVFMFDLSQDLPHPEAPERRAGQADGAVEGTAPARKRKRDAGGDGTQQGTSGAGDRIAKRKLAGFGSKMRKTTGDGTSEGSWIRLDQRPSREAARQGDGEPAQPSLQREDEARAPSGDGDGDGGNDNDGQPAGRRSWWSTLKYRPILGMVPIGHGTGEEEDADGEDAGSARQDRAVEVVLVERPSWDLDLPPRFVGNHERE